MPLAPDDRVAITDLINLHGHLCDDGALDRLEELFTADARYDLTDFGQPPLHGCDAIRTAARALGDANPVGHHVTNIVLTPVDADTVRARSKAIGIRADGTAASVVYDDTVVRRPEGWRITARRLTPRRKPLGGR